MRAPKRTLVVGEGADQIFIELAGDVYACMEYEEVSGGTGLEWLADFLNAKIKIVDGKPVAVAGEEGQPKVTTTMILDMLYAFSATWRDDSGWNSRHHREADPLKPPRERARYLDLAKTLGYHDKRRASSILLALLLETVLPPGGTATANGPSSRQDDRPQE